jgi:adenylate cyclase
MSQRTAVLRPAPDRTGRVALPVDIRLLGHLEVLDPAGAAVPVPGERQRALLALLALAYPRAVTIDRLVDSLWADGDGSEAALQVAVSRLRKAIGPKLVESVAGGYQLAAPANSIDVDRFRGHTRRGVQMSTLGHPGKAAEAFRHGLSQWRGSPLSDLTGLEFAETAARALEHERIDVAERMMEAMLAAGDHQLIVGDLAGLAEAHPTRERLWYLLMLALYRSGRQAEALRACTRLRRVLGEELGVDPSPEVRDLEERILLHDPSLAEVGMEEGSPGGAVEAQLVSFKPGEVIVEEGSPADSVYWIEDGLVDVYRRASSGDETLAQLGRGHYFGELASLLGTGRTASVRAVTATTVSVHGVTSFRRRLGVERADSSEETSADAVAELVRRGDYLRAFDRAAEHVDRGETDPALRYWAVLALARSGATLLARRRFEMFGLATVDPSTVPPRLAEDIAALAPRLDKDMALASDGEIRVGWARRSALGYEEAYRRIPSPYLGSNAATMWLLAGDRHRAEALAGEILERMPGGEPQSYWDAVIAAECALVLGRLDDAKAALTAAARAKGGDRAARATTLRQLRLVCELCRVDPDVLRPIHNPSVAHYTGHRVLPDGKGRFPVSQLEEVAAEFRRLLADHDVGVGFGSLAAGADILAAEALLDRGAELHVVLPFDRTEFVRVSVAPAGDDWERRFDRCIAAAASVTTAVSSEYLDDPVLFDFCARIAMGDALVRADLLQTGAVQVAVWDGAHTGGPAGTEVDIRRWRATGRQSVVIGVGDGTPEPYRADAAKRQVRGLVFADFAGFSKLSDAQTVRFQDLVMGALSRVVATHETELLAGRTWGDGIYLVFADVTVAARCALELQEAVKGIDFDSSGLGSIRGMRIAAHASPVFDGWDPIAGTRLFYGSGVTQTARIEPRTPEGEVYVTHPFAALAMLDGDRSFECTYVGTIEAAKGYGPVPLYALRSRKQTASAFG